MKLFRDVFTRQIRLTDRHLVHLETDHPEMAGQIRKIEETLLTPDCIVRSTTDHEVELFYKYYPTTPVTEKYLCVVAKILTDNRFVITSYFTKTIKQGELLYGKRSEGLV
ncbi:MAG: PBECR2 nuclease fold domain-containing protein [Planctomycetota bacterium]|nr:PBECR2 nuclease fold domain-containing protein [Planctomycetota bacterium]MDI6787658.1 PBECR2 nuclease fold domain-containing protein [Planctomycetota bacterium]